MSELRECPCCSGDSGAFQHNNVGSEWYFAGCVKCHLRTADYPVRAAAIAAWNQRATDAELDRLRELERAAETVWQEFKAGRAFACDARKKRITLEALDTIAAIGRLLEGKG